MSTVVQTKAEPISRLFIYAGAKVDPTYENILLRGWNISETTDPTTEFSNYGASSSVSYVNATGWMNHLKPTDKSIKVPVKGFTGSQIETIKNANYMRFINESVYTDVTVEDTQQAFMPNPKLAKGFENGQMNVAPRADITGYYNMSRWYFAFVTKVEYVNDDTYEVFFEIDIFQTYLRKPTWQGTGYEIDYTLLPCFVEREHSNTDAIGDNLIPENLELGDYTVMDVDTHLFGDWMVLITATKDVAGDPPVGQTFANVYTPLYMLANIRVSQPNQINEALNWFIENGQEDSIISVQEYPAGFGVNQVREDSMTITMPTALDGYTPKNRKLLTYPYNMLVVTNRSGGSMELKWEQWKASDRGKFKIYSCALGSPTIMTVPEQYRGKLYDFDSALTWQNAPVCPFAGDAYKAYWAQNKNATQLSGLASLMSTTASLIGLYGGVMSESMALMSGVGTIGKLAGIMGKREDTKAIPNQLHGQLNADYLTAGLNQQRFEYQKTCIRAQFARSIDDYFTAFGYATNRIKTPNVGATCHRRNWCYVKTQGCQIKGTQIPASVIKQMQEIFDRGVRVWKTINNYLDLSQDNSII